jgi:hypothetical protein
MAEADPPSSVRDTTMSDVELQVRSALGDPPIDEHARRRALVRLKAEIAEARTDQERRGPRGRVLKQVAAASVAMLVLGFVISSFLGRQPAVASQLQALASANDAWRADHELPPVVIDETYLSVGTQVSGGPSFSLRVHAQVSRSIDAEGHPIETKTITSSEFASETDERIWASMGSPPLEELDIGHTSSRRLDRTYNFDEVTTDATTLMEALKDGRITASGYEPTAAQEFGLIASLLLQPELDEDQRAALYEVVGSIDGVQAMGDVADPTGRTGVGFSRVVGSKTHILIFDRGTGLPLAAEETPADDQSIVLESLVFDPPT